MSTIQPPESTTFGMKKISAEDSVFLNQPIELLELEQALAAMRPDKAPGRDGLTYEFYSKFWPLLGPTLLRWSQQVVENGKLTGLSSIGVITLIPKKGDLRDISNWRPITLLTTDVKIILKVLANRLKQVVPSIIPGYQTGIPGRSICDSLAIIRDTIALRVRKKEPLYILSLDQQKAFDRVNHAFLFHLLTVIDFPLSFVNIIKAFYLGFVCCIKNASLLTTTFPYSRGIRQGDPLATLLYAIALQPVLNMIVIILEQHTTSIVPRNDFITTYADDVSIFLSHPDSVKPVIQAFEFMSIFSEACLNLSKSSIISIVDTPSCPLTNVQLLLNIPIVKGTISILGVSFSKDGRIAPAQWDAMLSSTREDISKALYFLKNLQYSQRARWTSTKLWPKWAFLFRTMQPSEAQLSQLSSTFADAIWLGAKHWISPAVLTLPINKGGLGMVSIKNRLDTYRIKHLIRCWETGSTSTLSHLAEQNLNLYNGSNLGFRVLHTIPDTDHFRDLTPFYRAVFLAWNRLSTVYFLSGKEELLLMPCFNSKHLQEAQQVVGLTATQATYFRTFTVGQFLSLQPSVRTRTYNKLIFTLKRVVDNYQYLSGRHCTCQNTRQSQQTPGMNESHYPSFFMKGLDDKLTHMCSWTNKYIYSFLSNMDFNNVTTEVNEHTWKAVKIAISPAAIKNRYWRFLHDRVASSEFFAKLNPLEAHTCILCGTNNLTRIHQFQDCSKLRLALYTLKADIHKLGLNPINTPFVLYYSTNDESLIANFLTMAYIFAVLEAIKSLAHSTSQTTSQHKLQEMYLSVPAKHLVIMARHCKPEDPCHNRLWSTLVCKSVIAINQNGLLIRTKDGYLNPEDTFQLLSM